jgi:hypothetical protein
MIKREFIIKDILFEDDDEKLINKLKPCYIDNINKIIYNIIIPNDKLLQCKKIELKNINDFDLIPNNAGLYWISTNEPINHCFNSGIRFPSKINDNINIIYNGSCENIKLRIKEHLLRKNINGSSGSQSGISIDIIDFDNFDNNSVSHIKSLWNKNKKIPKYILNENIHKIINKEDIINNIYFSDKEKEFIINNDVIYFKNGIDLFSSKHINYNYYIHYLTINNHNIRDYIEIEWRKNYGTPILCSYVSGR